MWQAYDQTPAPYFQNWDATVCWIAKATAFDQVRALAQRDFDVFVNLCDGCVDDDEAGIEVVHALEQLHLPFTGARSDFYDPSREQMKRACERAGVSTPRFLFVTSESQIAEVCARLRLPLIVKHPNAHSSEGLFKESLIENAEQLDAPVHRMLDEYGGALIEEFIVGREFDVFVVENADNSSDPFAYSPAEFLFPPGETFKHYNLKWIDYDAMQCVPCGDPVLAARLQVAAKKLFVALNGTGYGRCDFRVNAHGEPFVLEINPNCGIFYAPDELGSADFILMQHPDGHDGFIERILKAAIRRQWMRE